MIIDVIVALMKTAAVCAGTTVIVGSLAIAAALAMVLMCGAAAYRITACA